MIRHTFKLDAKKIKQADLSHFLASLPNNNEGTRAKAFIQELEIRDVESLLRLTKENITRWRGFGEKTASALACACKKNGFRLGMLFAKPLNDGVAKET